MKKHRVYFPFEPNLQPNSNGHKWQLTKVWTVFIDGVKVEIPAGFWTDFASIPGFVTILTLGWIKILDEHIKAALLHDWLYYSGLLFNRKISRYKCDLLFLDAMEVCGTGYVKRNTMYAGVRSGGWVAWNMYRKTDKDKNENNN